MKNILFVFGTRPEAIKVAPLILKLKKNPRFNVLVCSTGQHREMLKPILHFFEITPDFNLDLMTPNQALTVFSSRLMLGMQEIIDAQNQLGQPIDQIIVQGDTTSSLIGGLVAFYNQIEVIHLEAGLRSHNIQSPFPEEFNRKALSLATSIHLAPTAEAKKNLLHDNVKNEMIYITGNTGIDALFEVKNRIETTPLLRDKFESDFLFLDKRKKMILVTVHRRESFKKNIKIIMSAILALASMRDDIEFLIPLHLNPEVRKIAAEIFKDKPQNIHIVEPIDYIPFVYIMNRSYLIITDSGGIQEEAPSLGKPVLIARENTERPEAIAAGTSKLITLEHAEFIKTVIELLDNEQLYSKMSLAKNPFGDGQSCEFIENIMCLL